MDEILYPCPDPEPNFSKSGQFYLNRWVMFICGDPELRIVEVLNLLKHLRQLSLPVQKAVT
ncbi:unnamed protein product [Fusarium graminearum]|nr:unnamed protein product [Fusarium graminearum]CAG1994544.1 unnamed protein product [Fusarium graminearum]VTO83000.1 unnamed protein product [Fusarium graminearum]